MKTVNVLGTKYRIIKGSADKYPQLKSADGYCDHSVKQIVVLDCSIYKDDVTRIRDLEAYEKKVTRHEVIHAFFYESGLWVNSFSVDDWATNEEMTDWFAIQSPKISKVFQELGIM